MSNQRVQLLFNGSFASQVRDTIIAENERKMSLYMGICEGLKGQSTPACAVMGGRTDREGDQSFNMSPICQNLPPRSIWV